MDDVSVQVEPSSLGAVLDAAFRLFMRNAPVLMFAFALSSLPSVLVAWVVPDPALVLVTGVFVFVCTTILSIAVIWMAHQDVRGVRVGLREALGATASRILPALLAQGAVVAVVAAAALPLALAVEVPIVMIVAVPLFFVVAFAAWIFFAFVLQVVVVERRGLGTLKRSASIVRGHMLRVFAILLVFVVLGLVVAIALGVSNALALPEGEGDWTRAFLPSADVMSLGEALVQTIATALFTPISVIALTLLYVDIRIRKEGYDVELLASADELDAGAR